MANKTNNLIKEAEDKIEPQLEPIRFHLIQAYLKGKEDGIKEAQKILRNK